MDVLLASPPQALTTSVSPRRFAWAFFPAFALVWVFLPWLVNQTVNRDTIQIVYWGREWQAGYFKHPPLVAWLGGALREVFGPTDTVFYLTGAILVLATFAAIHRLARRYLGPWAAMMATVSLTVIGFYSYLLPNLNHNVVLLLPWAMILLCAHGAIEQRRPWAWVGLGMWFGIGILTKYTVLVLGPLLLAHMLAETRHRALFLRPGPWLALGIAIAVALPHLSWLMDGGFAPLRYAADGAGLTEPPQPVDHLLGPLLSLGKMVGMAGSLVVLLAGVLGRPRWRPKPPDSAERFLILVTLGPPAMVLGLAVLTGGEMRNEWAMPFFLPLPLLLLHRCHRMPDQNAVRRFSVGLGAMSLAMVATYTLIFTGFIQFSEEDEWSQFPARALAARIGDGWAQVCPGTVPVIVGDSWLAGTASYLLPGRVRVYTEADSRMAPWLYDGAIRDNGAVVVWNKGNPSQFRDLDHQDEDNDPDTPDWFPGLESLAARFGAVRPLPDAILSYGGIAAQPPAVIGLAVVPPAKGCR